MVPQIGVSVVIPTRDRADKLLKTIQAFAPQEMMPKELIIVDDGELCPKFLKELGGLIDSFNIRFKYVKKERGKKGLNISRNLGIKEARCDWVVLLDDDITVDENFFSVLDIVLKEKCVGKGCFGLSGMVNNARKKGRWERLFDKFFLFAPTWIYDVKVASWDVTDVGYQIWDQDIDRIEEAYYINGGLCCLKREKALEVPFRQLSPGRSPGDDVDLCWRAKNKGYYFYICPYLRGTHQKSEQVEDEFERGVKEGMNQKQMFVNNCWGLKRAPDYVPWNIVEVNLYKYLMVMKFWWSSFGWVLRQVLAGHFRRAFGMVKGYLG